MSSNNNPFSKIFIRLLANVFYPVGSIYMSVNDTDPSTLFGGTWVRWSKGRVPIGVYEEDADFNSADKIGGSKTHALSNNEMPQNVWHSWAGQTGGINVHINGEGSFGIHTQGSNLARPFSIVQQYTTCYMWKRIA